MFDPEDFVKLAQKLVQSPCGAADSRTAISRAYYSAFLFAKRILDAHFQWPKTAEAHEQIYILFVNCRAAELKIVGRKLTDLRKKRNLADYDVDATGLDYHFARTEVGASVRLIEELRRMFASETGSGPIITEMKEIARLSGKVMVK